MAAQRLAVVLKGMLKDEYIIEHLTAELFGKRRHKVLKRFAASDDKVGMQSGVYKQNDSHKF